MDSTNKEVDRELLPFVRLYKDGTVERLAGSPLVPPFLDDPETGVSSKDITISKDPSISARIYLPKLTDDDHETNNNNNNNHNQKLPILVYFHGGAFCFESPYSLTETTLLKTLVSMVKVIAVSVDYRMAPEHDLPVAYQDGWAALNWVASHFDVGGGVDNEEPWISRYGDFNKIFVGGDSAGGNIAHNVLLQAGRESLKGNVKLYGAFMTHPFFWGSKPFPSEFEREVETGMWHFAYPSAPGGLDHPMINPFCPGAPSLAGLGCPRLLVTVAQEDKLRDRGLLYYNTIKESGWQGDIELIEIEGEGHAFHILKYGTEKSKNFIKRLASFLQK